ncbi:MAG: ribosome assembly RNA-binding protein YhbY [Myxococcota bacterium]
MKLTSRQRTHLKSLGHHLSPVVQVGHQGITEELVKEVDRALETHELIKVKFGEHAGDRHELAAELAKQTNSALAQVIGRNALLYRRREKDPVIELPKG